MSELDLYMTPTVTVVMLHSQNRILFGSPDPENAGVQDYIEQPELSW